VKLQSGSQRTAPPPSLGAHKNKRRALTARQLVRDVYDGFDTVDVAFVPTIPLPDSIRE
jgi:hypothetical protein